MISRRHYFERRLHTLGILIQREYLGDKCRPILNMTDFHRIREVNIGQVPLQTFSHVSKQVIFGLQLLLR